MKSFKSFSIFAILIIIVITFQNTFGSGTYRPSRSIRIYQGSEILRNDFVLVDSFFGVTKAYRHHADKKTMVSYQEIKNEEGLDPNAFNKAQYKKLFLEFRNAFLAINGAKNLKVNNIEHIKTGDQHRYKIEGQYTRHNGDKIKLYEWHHIQGNKMIQINLITLDEENQTISKEKTFELFKEMESELI